MTRLTQWIDEGEHKFAVSDMTSHKIGHGDCLNKLAEYEDLEEQGLLLRLPCKLGDTVYDLVFCDDEYHIMPMKVCSIRPYGATKASDGRLWNVYLEDDFSKAYRRFYDFGKTVFLTEQDAEAALKIATQITKVTECNVKKVKI
jgi:DNA modification methylase